MSQYDIPTIDPLVTTGTQLATYINSWVAAVESSHAGAARPAYASAGMTWVQQVSGTVWNVMLYTGTADATIGTINPTTGAFTFTVGGLAPANVDDAAVYAIVLG